MSNSCVRLSILIVNWNTKELLRQCIESIYQSKNSNDIEVIVVDNASTDGSTEMVRYTFPRVKLIQNKSNLGFAAANNQGLQICSGELILLLNSDTQVLNGALDKCVDYMKLHGKVGALGCRVLNPDGTLIDDTHMIFRKAFSDPEEGLALPVICQARDSHLVY